MEKGFFKKKLRVAYHLVRDDWPSDLVGRKIPLEHRHMSAGRDAIWRDDIPKYLSDPFVVQAFKIWSISQKYGLPKAGGWMEQPKLYMDILMTIDNEKGWADQEEMKKQENARH